MTSNYVRSTDGALMVETSPGCFVAKFTEVSRPKHKGALRKMHGTNYDRAYFYTKETGHVGATADDLVARIELEEQDGLPKVNGISQCLSQLKKLGITEIIGRREIRNGSTATVHALTDNAKQLFIQAFGRNPQL